MQQVYETMLHGGGYARQIIGRKVLMRTEKDRQPQLVHTLQPSEIVPVWLNWFDQTGRALPWRLSKDPYAIWVSEIMLQQTQVQTVIPYYMNFMSRFPSVHALAEAQETSVLKMWEGLGYYKRARQLLKAARLVVNQYGGQIPDTVDGLKTLPGIGEYTAGAILSIAWKKSIPAVDGNVIRVFSRLTGTPWTGSDAKDRREATQLVGRWLPPDRPGDFNEAVMDLGATVCLPREPHCQDCPLTSFCVALREQRIVDLPLRKARKTVPVDQLVVLILHHQGLWRVTRRPDHGLLGGLFSFDWLAEGSSPTQLKQLENDYSVIHLPDCTHRFTHRIWKLSGYLLESKSKAADQIDTLCKLPEQESGQRMWVSDEELCSLPFPTALEPYRQAALAHRPVSSAEIP